MDSSTVLKVFEIVVFILMLIVDFLGFQLLGYYIYTIIMRKVKKRKDVKRFFVKGTKTKVIVTMFAVLATSLVGMSFRCLMTGGVYFVSQIIILIISIFDKEEDFK